MTRPSTRRPSSIVAARFEDLVGKLVHVRVGWCVGGFFAELLSIVPAGRVYFVILEKDGKRRHVNIGSILEIEEAV